MPNELAQTIITIITQNWIPENTTNHECHWTLEIDEEHYQQTGQECYTIDIYDTKIDKPLNDSLGEMFPEFVEKPTAGITITIDLDNETGPRITLEHEEDTTHYQSGHHRYDINNPNFTAELAAIERDLRTTRPDLFN